MSDRREVDNLSVEELEELLYVKRRSQRRNRLRRLRNEGRYVDIDETIPPESLAYEVADQDQDEETIDDDLLSAESTGEAQGLEDERETRSVRLWKPFANRVLLVVEIVAVIGLLILAFIIWQTTQELNQEIAEAQQVESASVALPTPTATAVIGVVVLPSGHKPPINGRPPEPGEAGEIPEHLLPVIDAYIPPPPPTPGPEQARRIQIPELDIDKPVVQGDDWEQLKKGVAQHVGTGLPGRSGNMVLSAHNDIYGEIFRHLDLLSPGDEVIISSERQEYTYVVRETLVVKPTDVWVMAPTDHASVTLISCYPYLVNNKRIVVFADLASPGPIS